MKRNLAVLVVIWIAACSICFGADDPIIGEWDGIGALQNYHATFNPDHTYTMRENEFGGKEQVFAKGTWSLKDGKYLLPFGAPEGSRNATIDQDGRLVVRYEQDPPDLFFLKHGAKQPIPAAAGKPPVGEWRYAYTCRSNVPACCPAPFDEISFDGKGKVHLKSTVNKKNFDLGYTVASDVISIEMVKGGAGRLQFQFAWENKDSELVLWIPQAVHGPLEFKWKYFKPDQFLPCDVKGAWTGPIAEMPDTTEEIQFGDNGLFTRTVYQKGQKIHEGSPRYNSYYRLWKSPLGNMLTIVQLNEEMGMQSSQLFKYERKGDALAATAVELTEDGKLKPHDEAKLTWKAKK